MSALPPKADMADIRLLGTVRFLRLANGEMTYTCNMPIRPFLAGQAFEPEVIQQMSVALKTIFDKFGMRYSDGPAGRVVAQKIIELAQRGVRDAPTLTEMTLKELKHYLPYA